MSYAKKAGQYLFLWLVGPLYDADANWATYRSAVDSYNGMDCDYYFGNIYHFMEKRRGAG